MIGAALIRDDPDGVKAAVARKGEPTEAVDRVLAADARRRSLEAQANELRAQRNAGNKELGELMRGGLREEATPLKIRMAELSAQIDLLSGELADVEAAIATDLLLIPNLPDPSVPDGRSADDNPVMRTWGEAAPEGSAPPHWEIGERLGLFDLERGAKVTGSGFILYTGAGARLLRAIIGFLVDFQSARGYTEVWAPILVNAASARGTGQLPDKEEMMYGVERDELYLNPTAEVPVTNIYRDEILAAEALPIRHVAYLPSFRREAGAAGKDTRGLLRVHQFDKVELVKFVEPSTSAAELESLTARRGGGPRRARDPAPRRRALHRRPRLQPGEGLRPRGLVPGRRPLARGELHLELHRFPGPAHEPALPARARGAAGAGPHPERLLARHAADVRRVPRDAPAARRIDPRARCASRPPGPRHDPVEVARRRWYLCQMAAPPRVGDP